MDGNTIQLTPYSGLPTLYIAHNGADVERSGDWYYSFEYDRERERGLDFQEDLFNPFVARFTLRAGGTATFIASTEPTPRLGPDVSHCKFSVRSTACWCLLRVVRCLALCCLFSLSMSAVEHQGVVRLHGKGLPGVSIVATSGDQKLITSTDENGVYRLDLPEGQWQISTDLFSFEKQSKALTQTAAGSSLQWDLKLLPARQFQAGGPGNRQPQGSRPRILKLLRASAHRVRLPSCSRMRAPLANLFWWQEV